ncbi:MAG: gluconate 2-dehydrogenase subunit 3 family protein [Saprospiraceae bacterium]|nr:gluconate 2-dehydrogenase subunit 3 family protein [Saprospiraceae bacterium]
MKRREALHKSGWVLGSALFGPGLAVAIQGCAGRTNESENLLVFDDEQLQLVSNIADTILPKTDTVSASEVQVPQVIDVLLNDVYEADFKDRFLNGLAEFDHNCELDMGKSFSDLTQKDRDIYVAKIDREVMEKKYQDSIPFYFSFKSLCIHIYFLTEEGIKQNLNYNPIPGGFAGDIALIPGQKIEVGNEM